MSKLVKIIDTSEQEWYINLSKVLYVRHDVPTATYDICVEGLGQFIEISAKEYNIRQVLDSPVLPPRHETKVSAEQPEKPATAPTHWMEAEDYGYSTNTKPDPLPKEKTIEAAYEWVKAGKPCTHSNGWLWKGAHQDRITQELAEELLHTNSWSFNKGFHLLSWVYYHDAPALCFEELSELDME